MATKEHDVLIRMQADASPVVAASAQVDKALEQNAKTAKATAVAVSTAEKAAVAQIVGADAALKAKAKTLGITVTQTKKVITQTKALTKATKAAAVTTKGMSRSIGLVAQQLPDVFSQLSAGANPMQIFIQQGGQVIQQMDIMAIASKTLSAVASPAGLAVAAVGTAAVVMANQVGAASVEVRGYQDVIEDTDAATRSLVLSQDALRLAVGGVAGFIGDLQIRTALLQGDISKADVAAGELGGKLADKLRPALLDVGKAYAENEVRIQKLDTAIKSGTLNVTEQVAAMAQLSKAQDARTGLAANLVTVQGEADKARDAINSYAAALEGKGAESGLKSADKSAAKAAAADAKQLAALTAEVAKVQDAALVAQLDAAEKLEHKAQEQIDRLREIATLRPELAQESADAVLEIEQALAQDLDDIRAKQKAAQDKAVESELAAMMKIAGEAQKNADKQKEKDEEAEEEKEAFRIATRDAAISVASDIADAVISAKQREVAETEQVASDARDELDAITETGTEAEINAAKVKVQMAEDEASAVAASARKQANVAFAASQALAVGEIAINTAAAIAKAMAIWGPPPTGTPAMAAAAAIGVAQAGLVLATPPPEFHVGGVVSSGGDPSEIAARLLPGESVLNRETTARLGESGVNAMNRGGGMGGSARMVTVYKHRSFNNFMADNLRTNGPLAKAINGNTRVGHRPRT